MLCWTDRIFPELLKNLIFIWVLHFSIIGLSLLSYEECDIILITWILLSSEQFSKCGEKSFFWFVMCGYNSYPQTKIWSFLDLLFACKRKMVNAWGQKLFGWNSEKNIRKSVYYETKHESWITDIQTSSIC